MMNDAGKMISPRNSFDSTSERIPVLNQHDRPVQMWTHRSRDLVQGNISPEAFLNADRDRPATGRPLTEEVWRPSGSSPWLRWSVVATYGAIATTLLLSDKRNPAIVAIAVTLLAALQPLGRRIRWNRATRE